MGIFTRARDIIASNINTLLDEAEDPEKLATLIVREMEDTLIELKASCAGAMAAKHRIARDQERLADEVETWSCRAERAVNRGRDDLAREALFEKRRFTEAVESLERERTQCEGVIAQYQEDIRQLEEKLDSARERKRVLVQRHIHAVNKKRAQLDIRRAETTDIFARFDSVEDRVSRMEAEADLVNYGRHHDLGQAIDSLENDEEIEAELQRIKSAAASR